MSENSNGSGANTAPIFRTAPPKTPRVNDAIPSSSPAFDPPVHPIRPLDIRTQPAKPAILPILIPPTTLRPLAFRTFTKKHNLTITSTALQSLAAFIGKHCGARWREDGLADKVLDEVAKTWKKTCTGVIVDDGKELKNILQGLEGCMVGGRIVQSRSLSRQQSFASNDVLSSLGPANEPEPRPGALIREESQTSLGLSALEVGEDDEDNVLDLRKWLKAIDAFDQPRLSYNVNKKHFEKVTSGPSIMPDASHKINLFRQKYHLIHQRILRNETFQAPSLPSTGIPSLQRSASVLATNQSAYKITPISNLLGRSGSTHMLLGLLTLSPTGTLAITDLTGSISLDLRHAKQEPEEGVWFCPGMIVIVDGIYEEEAENGILGGKSGVGGTIAGKFVGIAICGPPCERRQATLGLTASSTKGDHVAGGGFGWVDFLGVGSERAIGSKMRRLEQKLFNLDSPNAVSTQKRKAVIVGEVNFDRPKCLEALKKLFGTYAVRPAEDTPFLFILMGNFVQHAVMAGGGSGGAIEYKEYFDSFASLLNDYPTVLQNSTFIFVPGDNDPWASSFSAGAATVTPRKGVPELFTSRVKRAFGSANVEAEKTTGTKGTGEAIWASNPVRLTLFGPLHEIVCFRDDLSGRLRRNAVVFNKNRDPGEQHNGQINNMDNAEEIMDIDSAATQIELRHAEDTSVDESVANVDLQLAQRMALSVLDQGNLAPFPLSVRPVLWDFASSLQLYPLPSAVVLMDAEAPPFCVTYEGCHVMNPGRIVDEGRGRKAKWIEYDTADRKGVLVEKVF